MKKIAVYAGSFDPFTLGHMDVLAKVRSLFDEVHVLIADNPRKSPLFTAEERRSLIQGALAEAAYQDSFQITSTQGLVVDYCKKVGARYLVRGLRAVSDFEGEFSLAVMSRRLDKELTTIHIMADEKYFFLSSSLVKELASFGRSVDDYVPRSVSEAIVKKLSKKKG